MAERLKAADCKSVLERVRWFESIPAHHKNLVVIVLQGFYFYKILKGFLMKVFRLCNKEEINRISEGVDYKLLGKNIKQLPLKILTNMIVKKDICTSLKMK